MSRVSARGLFPAGPQWRALARRVGLGLPTVFGFAGRGFFIPYRYADRLPEAQAPYAAIEALFAARADSFAAVIDELAAYTREFAAIGVAPPPAPRWNQDWFPRLDAAVAYATVRRLRPARIVEVGSGHSTRFLARARHDGGLSTRITAIDPAPRAAIESLPIETVRTPVPDVGLSPFADLAAGDILFVDSSHVLMPGSDVDFLLNRVVPDLADGVLLHLHDIFLPDDYPPEWRWRGYSEQLAVVPLLLGGGWTVLFASHYVATRMAGRVATGLARLPPIVAGARESSLWLERRRGHPPFTNI